MDSTATIKQITELDRIAMEEAGLDILQMMEIAGIKFALALKEYLGEIKNKNILVLAGSGHNGGDGLCTARYLNNWGATVHVILAKEKLKPASTHHLNILEKMNIPVDVASDEFPKDDLIVDALLGYNQTGDPKSPYDRLITKANESDSPIFSFDNPSGLNIDSGESANPTIEAAATITLAIAKKGLIVEMANKYVGNLLIADLGIPKWVYSKANLDYPFALSNKNYLI